jgi:hypothetical protein
MRLGDVKRKSVREKDCVWTEHKSPFTEDDGAVYQQDEENEQVERDRRVADS